MERSQVISGVGHAVVILWVVLGDWLFAPTELPPPASVQVSMVTSDQLAAMDAAAKSDKPKADKPEVKPAKKPAKKPKPPAKPPAKPKPAEVQAPAPVDPSFPDQVKAVKPEPAEVPVAEDPQPIEAPPAVAPIAEEAQPKPVPPSPKPPAPKVATKIADTPSKDPKKAPEVADVATPKQTDQPTDQPPVDVKKPEAAPEDTAQTIVPEAQKTDAPELAPTSSVRPHTRPEKPVVDPQAEADAQAAQDAKDAADKQAKADAKAAAKAEAEADAKAQADADAKAQADADAKAAQDAIDAALADATAEDAPATDAKPQDGGQTDIPEGPPMSAGETEGIRVAISKCWSTGTLSTAAEGVALTLRVEMNEDGTPIKDSITMTRYSGGDEAAAQQAFEAARRAVMRGVKGCGGKAGYELDPAKYGQWNVMNLNFDNGGVKLQ